MPGVLSPISYEPIRALRVLSSQGALPQGLRVPEAATQTFKIGVPLRVVNGYIQEATFAAADVIFGVSSEGAHNLANAGVGVDLSQGTPQNQPNAIITPIGAWPVDGNIGCYGANGQTVFSACIKVGQTFTQALIIPGTYYRLIKDNTSGFWYIDTSVTGGNAGVVNLIGMDPTSPNDGVNGTRLFFQFIESQRFFQ